MTRLTLNVLRSLGVIAGVMTGVMIAAPASAQAPAQPVASPQPAAADDEEPETGPHGDWIWAAQLSFGAMMQAGSGAASADLGTAPVVAFGAVRGLTCHVEIFAGGVLPVRQTVTFSGGESRLGPSGFQTGFTFKTCQRPSGDFYGGFVFGAYTKTRSRRITVDGKEESFTFPGGPGAGFTAGYRRYVSRTLALDAGIRWQRLNPPIGETDVLEWNPFQILVSALIRF
jgi:hypothetical protein